jgi:hypothetical protein
VSRKVEGPTVKEWVESDEREVLVWEKSSSWGEKRLRQGGFSFPRPLSSVFCLSVTSWVFILEIYRLFWSSYFWRDTFYPRLWSFLFCSKYTTILDSQRLFSKTPRLLTSSLSLGVPVPRPTQCVRVV